MATARLDVAAHGIEQDQKALDLVALLNGGKLGAYVFVFGGLIFRGQYVVPLNLARYSNAVDIALLGLGDNRAGLDDILTVLFPGFRRGVFCLFAHRINPLVNDKSILSQSFKNMQNSKKYIFPCEVSRRVV